MHFEDASPATKTISAPVSTAGQDIDSSNQEQILEHLAEISRTMKFFRRLAWGLVIAMVLNVIIMGAGLIYSMSMIGSLGGLLGSSGGLDAAGPDGAVGPDGQRVNLDALPAETRDQLRQIEEYQRLLQELAQEP